MATIARNVRNCTRFIRGVSHYATLNKTPRYPKQLLYDRQQCMYLSKQKGRVVGGGGGGKGKTKKGGKGPSLYNFVSDAVDIVELNGQMVGELNELKVAFMAINVQSNPSVLSQVYIRVGVERLPVTELSEITTNPGKAIILDCSIYSEHKQAIVDAINTDTAFKAAAHGKDTIQLISPKLTDELRRRLALQVKTQGTVAGDKLKSLRNAADATVKRSSNAEELKQRAQKAIHELYLHHKEEVAKLCKTKQQELQREFNL